MRGYIIINNLRTMSMQNEKLDLFLSFAIQNSQNNLDDSKLGAVVKTSTRESLSISVTPKL